MSTTIGQKQVTVSDHSYCTSMPSSYMEAHSFVTSTKQCGRRIGHQLQCTCACSRSKTSVQVQVQAASGSLRCV